MSQSAPRSIDQYLRELRAALSGADPALVQDALYDAEEYLRAEVASQPDKSEADVLELIASTYGEPAEVAAAYRTTEATVAAALAPAPRPAARGLLGRFFGVIGDSRAWTALFYALLALPIGILYFTVAVTGLSLSAGLAVLIIGVPFFLLFIGFTRILALAEGRLVEGLLGVRMPRRPRTASRELRLVDRIKAMLVDPRTWTTLLYMILMLPIGMLYFTLAVVALALPLALLSLPVMVLAYPGLISTQATFNDSVLSLPEALVFGVVGVILLTLCLHLARALGGLHGQIAKRLLVAADRE